jgi:protocatechuate 3,4-dioxygenase beta subunit
VGTWGASAVTDAAGQYQLTGLATGSYLVLAEAQDRPDFLPTFHGGGQDPQSATPVEVTAPEITPGIDIVLERGGSVAGTVRDEETGEPLPDIWVEIYLSMEGGPGPRRYLAAVTDAAGAYRIDGVPGGEQRVVASAWDRGYELEFYREATTPETATPILIVPPAEVSGIDFTLRRTQPGDSGIGGRVIAAEDEHPLPGAVVTAISLNGYAGFGLSDSSGSYWISGLPPDEYVVLAAAPGRLGVFYDQALSWEDATPVRVDGPTFGIDFALVATGGGRGVISGRVTDASGRGVGQAGIYAEPERTTSTSGFALSGTDGRYRITGLEPGRYRIRATRPGMNDAYAPGAPGGPPDWVTVAGQPVIDVLIVLGVGSPPPPGLRAEPSVPNPFRDQVAIRLTADRAGDPIMVDLYAVSGRHVRRLELEVRSPGRQEVTWDGRDASGALVPSGLYVYRAEIAGQSVSGRLVLVR